MTSDQGICGCTQDSVCDEHAPELRARLEEAFADPSLMTGTRVMESPGKPHGLHLVVIHSNENVTYHAVGCGKPWKIDAGLQLLVIGKGVGRVMVPLCNIMYFTLEEY